MGLGIKFTESTSKETGLPFSKETRIFVVDNIKKVAYLYQTFYICSRTAQTI